MTDEFKSITQYDKRFDGLFDDVQKKGFGCSYFSILSCWRFLEDGKTTTHVHEQNIKDAMTITCLLNIASGLGFEDLIIGCTDYDHKQIVATSVDLITTNVIGIHQMFPKINNDSRYAVMFLKSEKYFVVLVDSNGYYFRDCHTDTQHNFKSLDQLYMHLANSYQFTENVNVGGIEFEEYSSIEFLIFDKKFNTDITSILTTKLYDENSADVFNSNQFDSNQFDQTDYDLSGDIFEIPEKILLTRKDIDYLEMLNEQLNDNSLINANSMYTDLGDYDSNDFAKNTTDDAIDTDDLVDF